MSVSGVVQVWTATDFKPQLSHATLFAELVDRLIDDDEYSLAHLDVGEVLAYDQNKHILFRLTSGRISTELVSLGDDYTKLFDRQLSHIERAVAKLGIKKLSRVGFKTTLYSDLGLTFEELREQFCPLCVPDKTVFSHIVDGKSDIDDVALHIDYSVSKYNCLLRTGPMKGKQSRAVMTRSCEISRLFSVAADDNDLGNALNAIPESGLYCDIDVFKKAYGPPLNMISFFESASSYALKVGVNLKRYLLKTGK